MRLVDRVIVASIARDIARRRREWVSAWRVIGEIHMGRWLDETPPNRRRRRVKSQLGNKSAELILLWRTMRRLQSSFV